MEPSLVRGVGPEAKQVLYLMKSARTWAGGLGTACSMQSTFEFSLLFFDTCSLFELFFIPPTLHSPVGIGRWRVWSRAVFIDRWWSQRGFRTRELQQSLIEKHALPFSSALIMLDIPTCLRSMFDYGSDLASGWCGRMVCQRECMHQMECMHFAVYYIYISNMEYLMHIQIRTYA
jgi:hypothetical protein